MQDDEKKKALLEALQKRSEEKTPYSSSNMNKFDLERSKNLAKGTLDQDIIPIKSSGVEDYTQPKTVIGKTDKIDTIGKKVPVISGQEFKNKQMKRQLTDTMADAIKRGDKGMIKKLQMVASKMGKGLKAFPVVGSLAALAGLAGSEDASAAVPILDSADSAGMSSQDENMMMAGIQGRKDYDASPAAKDRAARLAALAKLSKLNE